MALNGTVLGQQLANIIIDPSADAATKAKITQQWVQIATTITSHIQQMGLVQVTVNPGQVVQTVPNTGTGSTTSPGTGTGKIL